MKRRTGLFSLIMALAFLAVFVVAAWEQPILLPLPNHVRIGLWGIASLGFSFFYWRLLFRLWR